MRRRGFEVPLTKQEISYDPLVDRHLQYYFSNKNNRKILVKTKVVNRRNEIIDKGLARKIKQG